MPARVSTSYITFQFHSLVVFAFGHNAGMCFHVAHAQHFST